MYQQILGRFEVRKKVALELRLGGELRLTWDTTEEPRVYRLALRTRDAWEVLLDPKLADSMLSSNQIKPTSYTGKTRKWITFGLTAAGELLARSLDPELVRLTEREEELLNRTSMAGGALRTKRRTTRADQKALLDLIAPLEKLRWIEAYSYSDEGEGILLKLSSLGPEALQMRAAPREEFVDLTTELGEDVIVPTPCSLTGEQVEALIAQMIRAISRG